MAKPKQLQLEEMLPPGVQDILRAGTTELARRAKIKHAHAELRRKGLRYAGATPPYGKRVADDGRRLEEHPDETAIIAFVVALRRQSITYEGILEQCLARGFTNRRGVPMTVHLVVRICKVHAPDVKLPNGRRKKKSNPREAA
jgi:hypothetical protein